MKPTHEVLTPTRDLLMASPLYDLNFVDADLHDFVWPINAAVGSLGLILDALARTDVRLP